MNINITNPFHQITVTITLFTTNKTVIRFTGRKVRRFLEEMCHTDGCDCFKDLTITVDAKPARISWIDPCVEDEQDGMEILLPPETEENPFTPSPNSPTRT